MSNATVCPKSLADDPSHPTQPGAAEPGCLKVTWTPLAPPATPNQPPHRPQPAGLPDQRRPGQLASLVALQGLGPHDLLLVRSHMRSYSSVLCHLLGSHPQVAGSGEQHLHYRLPTDLLRLRWRVLAEAPRPERPRWLLDKLLHNGLRAPERWLASHRSRSLVFVREPLATLRSTMALERRKGAQAGRLAQPEAACDYYVARLHRLRQDGERLGHQALYFDAERLHQDTTALLEGIGRWLGLTQPLQPCYQPTPHTGSEGYGDMGTNIHSGTVLGPEHSTVRDPSGLPDLPAAVQAEAQAAYHRCRDALRRHCATLD